MGGICDVVVAKSARMFFFTNSGKKLIFMGNYMHFTDSMISCLCTCIQVKIVEGLIANQQWLTQVWVI